MSAFEFHPYLCSVIRFLLCTAASFFAIDYFLLCSHEHYFGILAATLSPIFFLTYSFIGGWLFSFYTPIFLYPSIFLLRWTVNHLKKASVSSKDYVFLTILIFFSFFATLFRLNIANKILEHSTSCLAPQLVLIAFVITIYHVCHVNYCWSVQMRSSVSLKLLK